VSTDDGTYITANRSEDHIRVILTGTIYGITEIVQQLAWIASAFQVPSLQSSKQPYFDFKTPKLSWSDRSRLFELRIAAITTGPSQRPAIQSAGRCWESLFSHGSIALGFPVPIKPSEAKGLHIPLEIVANIIGAEKVTLFKDKLLIKGYSAMIFPTRIDEKNSIIIWHLIANEAGERISYADSRAFLERNNLIVGLHPKVLQSAQHIVGWCQNIRTVAGSSIE